jgi:hypothetical protein
MVSKGDGERQNLYTIDEICCLRKIKGRKGGGIKEKKKKKRKKEGKKSTKIKKKGKKGCYFTRRRESQRAFYLERKGRVRRKNREKEKRGRHYFVM